MASALVWLRGDLRMADNPALDHACNEHDDVVPVFAWHARDGDAWALGTASRWWLSHSLRALDKSLRKAGNALVLLRGCAVTELPALAQKAGAKAVYWNRVYEPAAMAQEREVEAALQAAGVATRAFNASLLHEPWHSGKKDGEPYLVFTPFWRALMTRGEPEEPLPAPEIVPWKRERTPLLKVEDLDIEPSLPADAHLAEEWKPGEAGAQQALARFLEVCAAYAVDRERPDVTGTSRLSPHLRFGEIGPRQVWHALRNHMERKVSAERGCDALLRQIVWREFGYHLLHHHPNLPDQCLRPEFARFPWKREERLLHAWQQGRTGYPIVDAAMRELAASGWMHNRSRMLAASFLVKHLLQPWQDGARWFWDRLVDADLANNTLGWQWVSGCGADAAPYFRIFNPVLQGRKFDPDGAYVRRWLPELRNVPAACIHEPWKAPAAVLSAAGVRLGEHYPEPIVAHDSARRAALAAYATISRP
ncbi:MAG TPA: deoxyribodipyrimidine photo-lyase [Candidatus Binatia bacterium]|nr:deoxyribodipyrimidine photo-lyase [Candidatus Binatia bacterium]